MKFAICPGTGLLSERGRSMDSRSRSPETAGMEHRFPIISPELGTSLEWRRVDLGRERWGHASWIHPKALLWQRLESRLARDFPFSISGLKKRCVDLKMPRQPFWQTIRRHKLIKRCCSSATEDLPKPVRRKTSQGAAKLKTFEILSCGIHPGQAARVRMIFPALRGSVGSTSEPTAQGSKGRSSLGGATAQSAWTKQLSQAHETLTTLKNACLRLTNGVQPDCLTP